MTQPNFDLDNTVKALIELKAQRAQFIAPIDEKISELETLILENTPQAIEGSKTTNGDLYKVTITNRINRTIDKKALDKGYSSLSKAASESFKVDVKLDLQGYRAAVQDPDVALELSQFITEKPGKPTIKLDIKGEK